MLVVLVSQRLECELQSLDARAGMQGIVALAYANRERGFFIALL